MQKEIETKTISPTFSARIDITDAERKITCIGNGDKETSELLLKVLKRLKNRMNNSELFTELVWKLEQTTEKELVISISKEDIEQLMLAILLL